MAGQKQDDQHEHTFSSYVRTRDVALKTSQRWWTIGRSGERGSGISVLVARHDDDNDDNEHAEGNCSGGGGDGGENNSSIDVGGGDKNIKGISTLIIILWTRTQQTF